MMPDLIAQGAAPEYRWRRTLPVGRTCLLGRDAGVWSTPWDSHISRQHAELHWQNGRLEVRRLEHARNPIFVRGKDQQAFAIEPGEHFVIGDTTFTLADERAAVTAALPRPIAEQTFSAEYLKEVRYRDADQRIELLGRVPEMILGATSDEEMLVRLVSILLAGVQRAVAAAVVSVESVDDPDTIRVLHWDRRTLAGDGFHPSQQLIRRAVRLGQSVMHVWGGGADEQEDATLAIDADWAFCTPVPGESCRGWAIYVAGRFTTDARRTDAHSHEWLRDDLKFTEVVATTLSNTRQTRLLERRQSSLRSMFSPVVLEALKDRDPEQVLAPREADVSVLFCDLRGFARQSEQSAHDLFGLLNRVSDALGVATRQIFAHGGVVGDFHGDAVMGFWGWPLAQDDATLRACRAAIAIREEFQAAAERPDHPLFGFRMGLGLATGRAVAGMIGTADQAKVTVFGPVVNVSSRLEGLTKVLNGAILMDGPTAEAARAALPPEDARVRRVAVVQPYGLDSAVEISELLQPASVQPDTTDSDIEAYEAALDRFLIGDWQQAFQLLHRVSANDQLKDFLTVYIAQHNRTPPENWDGVIRMKNK